jgi:hypothetical protein
MLASLFVEGGPASCRMDRVPAAERAAAGHAGFRRGHDALAGEHDVVHRQLA